MAVNSLVQINQRMNNKQDNAVVFEFIYFFHV